MNVITIFKNDIHHINLKKYFGYEITFSKVKEKVQNRNMLKFKLAKWRQKTYFVLFANACSILELMLCNINLTILVYQSLLGSNYRA